jgi:uncharacterized membrane protein
MNDTNLQHTEPQSARVTRTRISLLTQINLTQLKKHFLAISYTLFFLGFFFPPSSKSHSNFFYIAVSLLFLILIFMKKAPLGSFFSLLKACSVVHRYFLPIFAQPQKITDVLGMEASSLPLG